MTEMLKSGHEATLSPEQVQELRTKVRGTVAVKGEPGYDAARTIWNAMIDRCPEVVVRAVGAADVIEAVRFARANGTRLSVRGGGHNIAGNAVCEGGVLIDLSLMKSVRVDPTAQIAQVEPGVTLGEFDREAQAFGLATPLGINSTTGVAGLTLGGGFGWISRKHGLTVDNLIAADVVTADGRLLRADADTHPELFWALRGGGGNFGVVTSFAYRLHRVGPQVTAGLIVHPRAGARELLQGYRRMIADAPDELTVWAVLRQAPPLPFLPESVHGSDILVFAACWIGDPAKTEAALAPLRALGTPIADVIGPAPFAGWQTAFDPLLTPGARNYWKSHNFTSLTDELIDVLLDATGRLPGPECEVFIGNLDGAVNRVPVDATAYPHRDARFIVNVHTRWRETEQDTACVAWARGLFDAMTPFATGGVYVNFMPEDETTRITTGAYGPNYERLARIKAKYDPDNLFRMNQNITPSA